MEFFLGIFGFLIAAAVTVVVFMFWRASAVLNKGITATTETIKPIADAGAHAIQGVGNIIHGAADIVDVVAEKLRSKQNERVQLAAENAALHAQIQQLKGQRVSATAIERQLKIAFFSIKSKYTSFLRDVKSADEGGIFGLDRPTSLEFVGVVEAQFTAQMGVDIKKLTFALKGASTVYVHGAREVQSIGFTEITLNTLFKERREINHETTARKGSVLILDQDRELTDMTLDHRDAVLRGIQESTLASTLAEVNEKVAVGFFQAMLGGGRYEFVPVKEQIDQPLTFEQLCDEINQSLSRHIDEIQARQAQSIARAQTLDEEIVQVALEGHTTNFGASGRLSNLNS